MVSTRALFLSALVAVVQAANFTVVINGTASHSIPDSLYGFMFEDINSGDGGLYAEMLQNRAFQQVTPGTSAALASWSAVNGAQISVVDNVTSLSQALPNSLQVVAPAAASTPIGVANTGYFGINVNASWTYDASFFFKFSPTSTFNGSLTASLVSSSGAVLASGSINAQAATATDWTQFSVQLKPTASASDTDNTFQVTLDGDKAAGDTAYFALFSLFPPTFNNRPNGIRMDLGQALADIKPGFFRFPGGNNIGQTIDQRWIWNNTVGPLTERPGRLGDWGYINTDGLGLKEFLDFIEDVGMEPIMAVWAGYSFGGTVPESELAPYIQEAIDQINFVIGDPADSDAAALRASLGHPQPYSLQWVEIGNEDFFAADTYSAYRWADFVGNLSAAFPQLQFLATTTAFNPILTPTPQLYDIHVYQTPTWFAQNSFMYDSFERDGTKFFEGEYAAMSSASDGRFAFPVMEGSAGEAAFMTGFERNADIVFAASYAPLLQNINNFQWTPNLISFDASNVYLSTSYYVQKMFSLNKGTEYLPSTLPSSTGTVFWSITRDTTTNQIFIKISNTVADAATIIFELPTSVSSSATAEVLVGAATASNTPAAPTTVVPVTSTFIGNQTLTYIAPGFSVQVLTLSTV